MPTAPFGRAFVGLAGLSLRNDGAGLLNLDVFARGFGDCDLVCDCDLDWIADWVVEEGVVLGSGLVLFNCSKRANSEDTGFWYLSVAVHPGHSVLLTIDVASVSGTLSSITQNYV